MHASIACQRKLVVEWVAAPDLEETTKTKVSALLVKFYSLSLTLLQQVTNLSFFVQFSQQPDVHEKAWDLLKVSLFIPYLDV